MKYAIVLFNLGGPDSIANVKPFLFNLFYDRAIINIANPWRWLLAKLISWRRNITAQEIYKKIGGKSPLLSQTKLQAAALEKKLINDGFNVKIFISMRYWQPRLCRALDDIREYAPDKIILLPLYPQFSTTTTGSAMNEWQELAVDMQVEISNICCYPANNGFVKSYVKLLKPYLDQKKRQRILFSAHGLPEKIINAGDPYIRHIEISVKEIIKALNQPDLDYVICYQSRVGPLKWATPSTIDEIKRAGIDGLGVTILPISFVSENSETLVDLDIDMAKIAKEHGVPFFNRVATVGVDEEFITGLANLVKDAISAKTNKQQRICNQSYCQQSINI